MYLKNVIKHFGLITHHKWVVFKLCCKIGAPWRGLVHDMSKYSPTEFIESSKYYTGKHSPISEAKRENGYSKAWLHHKGRNKHHYEHWVDYSLDDSHVIMGAPMPRKYIAEMVMDSISASRTYMGDAYTCQAPLQYYLNSKNKLWFVHPKTKRDLEALLRILSDHGEEKALHYIKYVYLR